MKESTINRIIFNHCSSGNKNTPIGKYVYNVQFNIMAGRWYITRCAKNLLGHEWLNSEGLKVNGWEWVEPVR